MNSSIEQMMNEMAHRYAQDKWSQRVTNLEYGNLSGKDQLQMAFIAGFQQGHDAGLRSGLVRGEAKALTRTMDIEE